DLFVSPVLVEGETLHEVALPPGAWRDAWTGEVVEGAAVLQREVPIDHAAVYVRAEAWDRLAPVFAG
ncbi:MAG TPA: hypothetical protein VFE99_03275, partial [Agromyces sp.]|nr:hypothetical protein [Agromyces sp.]